MCQGNANCKDCKNCGGSNADGAITYDPKQIALFINKHLYDGKADAETLQEAYVKTMVWLEEKKLPFEEGSIASNKEELKVIVNDPNYLKDKENERPGWQIAVLLVAIVFGIWYVSKQA